MIPSMKAGVYIVNLLLGRDGELATIQSAMCDCAAGYMIIYIYVYISRFFYTNIILFIWIIGIMYPRIWSSYAIVSMNPSGFDFPGVSVVFTETSEEEVLPITLYAC